MDVKQKPVAGRPEGVRSDHFLAFERLTSEAQGPCEPNSKAAWARKLLPVVLASWRPRFSPALFTPKGRDLGERHIAAVSPNGGLPEPELAILTGDGGASVPARKAPVTDPHP